MFRPPLCGRHQVVLQANKKEAYFIGRGTLVQTVNIVCYHSNLVIASNNGIIIIIIIIMNKD